MHRGPGGYDWAVIARCYEGGRTMRECQARFGFSNGAWHRAVQLGLIRPRPKSHRVKPSEKRALVGERLAREMSYSQICRELGMSKATVAYHARRLGIPARDDCARRYDWNEVQRAYDSGLSVRECCDRFGFAKATWSKAAQRGDVKARPKAMSIDVLLVAGRKQTNRTHLKQRLLDAGLKENRCERCGITEWRGKPLNMELHHVNGDGSDNHLENLQLLCGNCHSQTDNWGGRGLKRNGNRPKVGND
jgi:5-methylcytosine-specific restriction endonuclease McrA